MHRARVVVAICGCVLAAGCAHNKANQYAYAPPLAPPVYPQPPTAAPGVVYPAPGPMVGAPMIQGVPPVTSVPVTAAGGIVPAGADGSCPPCADATGAVPVSYETTVQTEPCPQ